ncbi:MAG: aminodeoxychorismate lyase [Pseudomonadota bacterium]
MSWVVEPAAALADGPDSRAFAYGDGVFTSAAVREGTVLLLAEHLERLSSGCSRLGISPPSRERLHRMADAAVAADGARTGMLKLVVVRGGTERGYRPAVEAGTVVYGRLFPAAGADEWLDEQTLAATVSPFALSTQPALAGVKHLNRLEQVLALQAASGGDEAICVDTEGFLVSASSANLFFVCDETLCTPALTRAGIAGVTRGAVLAIAGELGIRVSVADFRPSDLLGCQEMLLSNSRYGIRPLVRIDDTVRPVGSLTRRLHAALLAKVGLCAGS